MRQRQGLVLILGGLIIAGAIIGLLNPVYVSDPPPAPHDLTSPSGLADRVDPNSADVDALAVVPGLGRKRAEEIVAFRARALERRPGIPVFIRPKDLEDVHGIGPATVENTAQYLIFPTTQP